jgi:threonine synthase
MKFVSTRDPERKELSYTDTLLAGLAPDRGLFVPLEYAQVSMEELKNMKDAPYTEIAFQVKKKIIGGDIPDEDLRDLVNKAYENEKFPSTKDGNITPLRKVEDNLYIQNLSAGPTAAFKDMAMQQLGQEMNYELKKRGESLTILGATSGDTGSAAEAAMK